jgi:hypothetical protein
MEWSGVGAEVEVEVEGSVGPRAAPYPPLRAVAAVARTNTQQSCDTRSRFSSSSVARGAEERGGCGAALRDTPDHSWTSVGVGRAGREHRKRAVSSLVRRSPRRRTAAIMCAANAPLPLRVATQGRTAMPTSKPSIA